MNPLSLLSPYKTVYISGAVLTAILLLLLYRLQREIRREINHLWF